MINATKVGNILQKMPHIIAVGYARTAFDLHSQGLSREQAELEARRKIREYPGIPVNMTFPAIPWDKFNLFYPETKHL